MSGKNTATSVIFFGSVPPSRGALHDLISLWSVKASFSPPSPSSSVCQSTPPLANSSLGIVPNSRCCQEARSWLNIHLCEHTPANLACRVFFPCGRKCKNVVNVCAPEHTDTPSHLGARVYFTPLAISALCVGAVFSRK